MTRLLSVCAIVLATLVGGWPDSTAGRAVAGATGCTPGGSSCGSQWSASLIQSSSAAHTSDAAAIVTSLFFADGSTQTTAGGAAADFTETLSILNPNPYATTYNLTYFLEQSSSPSTTLTVSGPIAANSVVQRSVNADVGANQRVSIWLTSFALLSATRTIARVSGSNVLAGSSSSGQLVDAFSAASSFTYGLASGEQLFTNDEYLTLLNPTGTAANVQIQVLPNIATAIPTISRAVPAMSRLTVPIHDLLQQDGLAIGTTFGLVVTSDRPLACEETEYAGAGSGAGRYAVAEIAAGFAPAGQYILANLAGAGSNSAIGTGNDLSEIDVINPAPASAGSATVTLSFFTKSGQAINSRQIQVAGGARATVMVNDLVGNQADVFSAVVTASQQVFVQKLIFFGGDPRAGSGGSFAMLAQSGSPISLTSAAFPFLDRATAGGASLAQHVFLYNPGSGTISVQATYMSNQQKVTQIYTVNANGVGTVDVNAGTASLPAGPVGGLFQLVQTGGATGGSFVASLVSNTAGFAVATGDQPLYPPGYLPPGWTPAPPATPTATGSTTSTATSIPSATATTPSSVTSTPSATATMPSSAASTPSATANVPSSTPSSTAVAPSGYVPFPTSPPSSAPAATDTPIPTSTPSATRTPLPSLPVHLRLKVGALEPRQPLTVFISTRPLTHLTYAVSFAGLGTRITGTTRADTGGNASLTVMINNGPQQRQPSLRGTIVVRVAEGGRGGSASASFTVYPPLRLGAQVRVTNQGGQTVLLVTVRLARAAQIAARTRLPGRSTATIVSRGLADGRHPLLLKLRLGALHGHVALNVVVTATAKDGTAEARTVAVLAHA